MDKYVARQPIKSLDGGMIIGYEILFQHDSDSMYNSPDYAAADTIAGFLMQNNERIFHDKLTFLTFTPSLLFRNIVQFFDKEKLVIQLEDSIIIHPLAPAIVKKYHDQGYRFAINDFQFSPKYFSMLEYADYIKVNIQGKEEGPERRSLDNLVGMMAGFRKKCIATGVNGQEDYKLALEVGADYLQGNYIAESKKTRYQKMEYLEGNFFQLVIEVSKEEPDIEAIEQVISRDSVLAYALLRMVNSAQFALRRRITSIRQAMVTVGLSQLRQWVYLLSFKDEDSGRTSEDFLKLSFLRANFASALAEKIEGLPISPPEAYMMGMFSTLDYLVDAPLKELLGDIPIADDIKAALLSKEGICGSLYQLILEYEQANWKRIKELSKELKLPSGIMAQMYMDCVETVNTIWDNIVLSSQ